MKGKINEGGYLLIQRGQRMKAQECPFTMQGAASGATCGDWCPHFGEPLQKENEAWVSLTCGYRSALNFEDGFVDERAK